MVVQYLAHNIFMCRYFRYVLIPYKCVIEKPHFFPNWRDSIAKYSCMYTTEISLDWSLPDYEDCGWYLDCPKDVCLSNEKVICQINDTKKINSRDTAILQTQIVQLKLREPKSRETKRRKKNIFMKKNTSSIKKNSQPAISQPDELFVLSNDLDKNTFGGEGSKTGRNVLDFHYWSSYATIHYAPMNVLRRELFILKNFLTHFFARSTAIKNKSEEMDVGPHEWIEWQTFLENKSNFNFVFCLLFLFPFYLILIPLLIF